mmetsp:Transcript_18002/g.64017  ORF Transcript_18002/g.64017 Transcript_18002/m.64017 type:complete len:219 (+) Transcript_18002:1107-1763(+)
MTAWSWPPPPAETLRAPWSAAAALLRKPGAESRRRARPRRRRSCALDAAGGAAECRSVAKASSALLAARRTIFAHASDCAPSTAALRSATAARSRSVSTIAQRSAPRRATGARYKFASGVFGGVVATSTSTAPEMGSRCIAVRYAFPPALFSTPGCEPWYVKKPTPIHPASLARATHVASAPSRSRIAVSSKAAAFDAAVAARAASRRSAAARSKARA